MGLVKGMARGWPGTGTVVCEPKNTDDPRLQAVKDVLGTLTDEGGKIFSSTSLDEISKRILYWIDEVK